MDTNNLISIQQFCLYYNVPVSFIKSLQDYDLIEVTFTENEIYVEKSQLNAIEKMIRLHFDLNINIEGIDAISNVLKQVDTLQSEIQTLRNKLEFYEKNKFN